MIALIRRMSMMMLRSEASVSPPVSAAATSRSGMATEPTAMSATNSRPTATVSSENSIVLRPRIESLFQSFVIV